MQRSSSALWLLGVGLGLALVTTATQAALYAHNTLAAHPDWVTSKRLLAAPMMGGTEQLLTRNMLQGNRLNLEPWHAHNEVLLNRVLRLGSLRFRFRLDPGAYLYVVFHRTPEGFSALRLSRSARYPSAWLRATPGGRFLERRPVPLPVPDSGWHVAELTLDEAGARFALDGVQLGLQQRFPTSAGRLQVLGFRGGRLPVALDDVEVRDARGRMVLTESFANWRGALGFALTAGALLLAAGALLLAGLASRRLLDPARARLGFLTLEIVLLCATSSWLAFDFFVWSGRYPYQGPGWRAMRFADAQLGAETLRRAVASRLPFVAAAEEPPPAPRELVAFLRLRPGETVRGLTLVRGTGSQQIETLADTGAAISTHLAEADLPAGARILLLGTSQAWGSGAWRSGERLAARLQHHLSRASPHSEGVVLDGSVPGSRSGALLRRFRSHLRLFEPGLVVVQLSNNDRPEGFGDNLSAIADQARSIGARTLFVLEAVSTEDLRGVGERHSIMRRTGAATGVPIADLHAHLSDASRYDSGILWWDGVHLTPWGQELAARFLANAVLELIGPEDAEPRLAKDPTPVYPRGSQLPSGRYSSQGR